MVYPFIYWGRSLMLPVLGNYKQDCYTCSCRGFGVDTSFQMWNHMIRLYLA